ncbi:MAG: competence/damage-inducible protein A [Myxococcales bacterium]|nr:competence/damage-inducible protein A [Myxococcales bacterium]
MTTAAALIIGNEILTGKIDDTNTRYLARELFRLGVELRRVIVCPDDLDTIAADLNALRAAHDYVFTSGGVGPTHDDITIDGVALAFGRPVVRSEEVAAIIAHYYGDRLTEEHLRMANMPEGAQLIRNAEVPWPTVVIENVYVLPGVPEIFKMKFRALEERFRTDAPFVSHAVYTLCDEGTIAARLSELAAQFPNLTIGSYMKWDDADYRVKITFDGRDADAVHAAADALVGSLPEEIVVRRE